MVIKPTEIWGEHKLQIKHGVFHIFQVSLDILFDEYV